MMGFKNKTIIILILIFGVFMDAYSNERKDSCIIFWNNNPDLSIEYFDKTDYRECITQFPEYDKLDFSEIERFDQECQVFVLRNEIDNDIYNRITNHEQLYISIVVDNKIVFNGINGSALLPARMLLKMKTFKNIINIKEKMNLVLSDKLFEEDFIKRDTLDKQLKKLISNKIQQSSE